MKELSIFDFSYKEKRFIIISSDFEKIHDGNIEILNHKTNNKETFKLSSRSDDIIVFENKKNGLTLEIRRFNN